MCFLGEGNWSKVAEVWIFGDLSLAKKNEPTYSSLVPKERKKEIMADFSLAETPEEIGWLNEYKYWALGMIISKLADFGQSDQLRLKNYKNKKIENFPLYMIKLFMRMTKLSSQTAFVNRNEAMAWIKTLPNVEDVEIVRDDSGFFYFCELTLHRKIIHLDWEEEQKVTFQGPASMTETLAIILAGGLVILDIYKSRLDNKSGRARTGLWLVEGVNWSGPLRTRV